MNYKKIIFLTIVILLVVVYIVRGIIILMIFGGIYILPSRMFGPPPEIQHAEFPFKLVYKINDDVVVAEDVLVGDFKRNNYVLGLGKVKRKWKASLKSGKKYISLYSDDKKEIFYQPTSDPDIIKAFMGDDSLFNVELLMQKPVYIYIREGKSERITWIEELKNKYNIQIITWEIAPPIENKFE